MLVWILVQPVLAATLEVPSQHATLQAAVNAASSGDTIRVAAGTYTQTVTIASKDLTILGSGEAVTTLHAVDPLLGAFEISGASDVVLAGFTFDGQGTDAAVTASGGSSVTFRHASFTAVSRTGDGGAIAVDGGALVVEDSSFEDGAATGDGGFLHATGGASLTVRRSRFANGSAANGGAVACDAAPACEVTESWFEQNAATGHGGAVRAFAGDLVVSGSVFCHNDTTTGGGGAQVEGVVTLTVEGSLFFENTALKGAGAQGWNGGDIASLGNTFVGNDAGDVGSSLHSYTGHVDSTNDLFASNEQGGGRYTLHVVQGSGSVDYALFYDNVKNHSGVTAGANLITGQDPLFVSYVPGVCDPIGLFLQAGSPAIDAGDPAILDLDGTTSDIGMTGGPDPIRDEDGDGWLADIDDCDDGDPAIHPGAVEIAGDGIDQDCDGAELCFVDGDDDGHGSTSTASTLDFTCTAPGFAPTDDDCDDAAASRYPGATEIPADGVDSDCDTKESCYQDTDGDDFGSDTLVDTTTLTCIGATFAPVTGDCDDAKATVYPGAPETVANGVDESCDGKELCYVDADKDGFGTGATTAKADLDCVGVGYADEPGDCDDAAAAVNPDALEVCGDGTDNDCDGVGGGPGIDDDGDGIAYVDEVAVGASDCSLDSDFDTVLDATEYPYGDSDGDGAWDIVDNDDDDDGILTILEGQGNPESTPGTCAVVYDDVPSYLDDDSDGDGTPDAVEGAGDDDNDGILNFLDCADGDGCAGDSDADGIGNCDERDLGMDGLSPDSDGDGAGDAIELGSVANPLDTDGDEIIDALDLDDDGDGLPTIAEDHDDDGDPMSDDTDEDGTPDFRDDDDDGDGTLTKDEDRDGDGDLFGDDLDGDGLADFLDRWDLDGPDADLDGDGLLNGVEVALGLDPHRDDSDGDGVGDLHELGPDPEPRDSDRDGHADAIDPDDDGDGIPTIEEGRVDTDSDGTPDYLDLDSDGDGVPDADERDLDGDCDGISDVVDAVADGTCDPVAGGSGRIVNTGCQSAATPASGSAWLAGALLLLARRRRAR